jgi:hypothetical protein
MMAKQQHRPPTSEPSDTKDAPQAEDRVADDERVTTDAEEPIVAVVRSDEAGARLSQEQLEAYEAEIERAGEDKALLESEARRFVRASAITPEGEELGVIQDLIVGPDGVVQAVALDVASFLGLAEHQVAIAWDEIEVSADDRVVIDMSPEDLRQLDSPR